MSFRSSDRLKPSYHRQSMEHDRPTGMNLPGYVCACIFRKRFKSTITMSVLSGRLENRAPCSIRHVRPNNIPGGSRLRHKTSHGTVSTAFRAKKNSRKGTMACFPASGSGNLTRSDHVIQH